MVKLLSHFDAERRLKLVLEFFNNDMTKFTIHLGNYLNKNKNFIRSDKSNQIISGHTKLEQSNQNQKEKEDQSAKKIITNMDTSTELLCLDHGDDDAKKLVEMTKKSIFDGGDDFDMFSFLKSFDEPTTTLEEAQRIRRVSALETIATNIISEDGRKMSSVEKNASIVSNAIQLADIEEKEDDQAEEQGFSNQQKEFSGGDSVVIIEGDNCGLFGKLQSNPPGIFDTFTFPIVLSVKETDDGYFGVDVELYPGTKNTCIEGFWIHPDALYHKKYEAGEEVYVTDGLNTGNYGTIQSDNGRLLFDDGCYGVDVNIPNGTVDGFWIHPRSLQPANESPEKKKEIEKEKETKEKEEKEAEAEFSKFDKFEFLPYVPYPDCSIDLGMATLLNTHEIDINIKRLVTNSGKVIYRWNGKRHLVRFIHGVLLVKENGKWTELAPILQAF